jgi:membrane protease YdiL (CAAX protease family)
MENTENTVSTVSAENIENSENMANTGNLEKRSMSTGGKIWWVLYPVVLYFGISLLVSIITSFVLSMVVGMQVAAEGNMDILTDVEALTARVQELFNSLSPVILIIQNGISLLFTVLFYRRDNKRYITAQKAKKAGFLPWLSLVLFSIGFSLFFNLFTIQTGIYTILGGENMGSNVLFGGNFILAAIAMAIVAPVAEEVLFRGLIFRRLRSIIGSKNGFLISAGISSVIFGLVHMNVLQGLYAFLIGMFLCYVYEKTRNLVAPMLAHALANAVAFFGTFVISDEILFGIGGIIITAVCAIMSVAGLILAIRTKITE